MTLLPIFLKLDGRRCLVVGAGTVALDKIGALVKSGARVRVVAPRAHPEVQALVDEGAIAWTQRRFEPSDLNGQYLAIAATDAPAVNAEVYRQALERGILCNSVDDIPNCDFFFGSVVRRGELQIAISTAGESPALAQRLRREIDEQLPADLGPWLEKLGELRREILATHPRGEQRRLLLHELAQRQICDSPLCPSRQRSRAPLAESKVYLVGAGPGDPELLTVKALRLIESANVILHDDLVPQAVLDLASASATVLNVGKRCGVKFVTQEEINRLMVEYACAGRAVVRLKSGDPLVFGRAAEEMSALREAGIAFEVVPGITAAFAAAAAAGCPLTDRNSASGVVFSTGHRAEAPHRTGKPATEDATRIVYMPGRDLSHVANELVEQGLPPDLPCAIVSRAAQPDQQIRCTTLSALGDVESLPAPSLLIAGWAVSESSSARLQESLAFPVVSCP